MLCLAQTGRGRWRAGGWRSPVAPSGSGDCCLSGSTCCCGPVNRSSCASVGGRVLRRLPAWLRKADTRHHRRVSYSKSAQEQRKKRCNKPVRAQVPAGRLRSSAKTRTRRASVFSIPTGLQHSAQGRIAGARGAAILPWEDVPEFRIYPARVASSRPAATACGGMMQPPSGLRKFSGLASQGRPATALPQDGPTLGSIPTIPSGLAAMQPNGRKNEA